MEDFINFGKLLFSVLCLLFILTYLLRWYYDGQMRYLKAKEHKFVNEDESIYDDNQHHEIHKDRVLYVLKRGGFFRRLSTILFLSFVVVGLILNLFILYQMADVRENLFLGILMVCCSVFVLFVCCLSSKLLIKPIYV